MQPRRSPSSTKTRPRSSRPRRAYAEQATKQLTEVAEQAKAAQKQQSLAAIDAYEQAVLALADSFEQAATEQPKVEIPNLADVTREITTAYTSAGTPARRLTRSSEVLAAVAPFGAAAAFRLADVEVVN